MQNSKKDYFLENYETLGIKEKNDCLNNCFYCFRLNVRIFSVVYKKKHDEIYCNISSARM